MINRLLQFFIALFLFATALPTQAQQIYYYSNAANGAYNALAANLTASNLTTVGSWGSNTPCSAGGGISGLTTAPSFTTYNPTNASSPALNVNITPNAGYFIQINTIAVSLRRSGTGPTKARLAYSTDGGVTWMDNGSDYAPNNAGCGSFANYTWTLASPAYLCSGMLKVRVYYYASGAATGTCQTANLRITGVVAPITPPSVSITASPAGPVCAGTTVTFTANPVNGGTTPVYTWRLNGNTTGTNSNTYANSTLTSADIVTCEMVSNMPCTPSDPANSNAISIPVIQPVTLTLNDTLCAGETYTLGAQTLNTSGAYTAVFTGSNSCDSTVNLNLYIRPAISHVYADTLCAATTYNWGGQNLSTSGTYNQTFSSSTNCDSAVTLNLFVRPAITYIFSDTACAGSPYSWAGQSFAVSGSYNHTFTSYTNCDSLVTLHLYIRPAITHVFADTICSGATYSWAGQNITTSGSYNHTFTSFTTCDSITTLNLYVRPAINTTFADTVCNGATYNWAGQAFTASGSYNHTFTSYTNCDSTVTLHLFVRSVQHTLDTQSTCFGVAFPFGNQLLNTSGTYTHVFTNIYGCDSTVTLTLHVNAVITDTFSATVCAGTNYVWGTQTHTTTGIYNQTFTAANGCDSLVTLLLTVHPTQANTISVSRCHGETYTLGSQTLNQSGTYSETFTNANGCDSIITLHLSISPAPLSLNIDSSACGTVTFEGIVYTSPALLTDTFITTLGCDSVYRTVNIHPYAKPVIRETDTSGCSVVTFEGRQYNQSTTLQDTLISLAGCDSLVRIIHIHVNQTQAQTVVHEMCTGEQFTFNGQLYHTEGAYPLYYKSKAGCDSTVTLEIIINPLPEVTVLQEEGRSYCIGDSVRLQASGADTYLWRYHDTEHEPDNYFDATLYQDKNFVSVTGTDHKGCRNKADIMIEAQPCCDIWMPNAFSPNADGLNDIFKPEAKGHPSEYVMHIYNRWGETVFSSFNISKGWDGTINGKPAEVADYYYRLTGKCVSGELINRKGTCTLIR